MTTFLQLHVLTSYPPANLNRDDTGRPKTAVMGRKERLRISSQALKHAWRASDAFANAVGDAKGTRTKRLGRQPLERAEEKISDPKKRMKIVRAIAEAFGKLEKGDDVDATTMVFLSPEERSAAEALLDAAAVSGKEPDQKALDALVMMRPRAADIAMFGRMLADASHGNVEAAVQVAHGITVHEIAVEDDYFTAVDDLRKPREKDDTGAAHIGEAGFAAGVFYLYVCVNLDLLVENLGGTAIDDDLAARDLEGLIRAVTTSGPKGKQASFASRAHASYCLAELGSAQPRSLSVAFLAPVDVTARYDEDPPLNLMQRAVKAIVGVRDEFATIYDDDADADASDASEFFATSHASPSGVASGSLKQVVDFAVAGLHPGTRS